MKRRLLFSLSALAGAGLATLVLQTGMLSGAIAASSETYRQIGLFGDVYDKVRTGYVEPPTEAKLIEGVTRPPPPELAFWPTTSSPRSTASPCRARPSIRPWTRCAAP
jgi:hypothetical protein